MVRSRSILIADDEPVFLESTARLLTREGYDCQCAADANEAIEKLRTGWYDLLISDVKMPGNQDLALVREARQIARGIPVILVTGYPSVGSAVSSLNLSVAAYLTKPLDFDALREQVRVVLERSQNYRKISEVAAHLQRCVDDLSDVGQAGHAPGNGAGSSTEPISIVTIRTLASCLSELLKLSGERSLNGKKSDLCGLLDCPQQPMHRTAVEDTIAVLKKTKNTFKSKELAELRIRLERVLTGPERSSNGALDAQNSSSRRTKEDGPHFAKRKSGPSPGSFLADPQAELGRRP